MALHRAIRFALGAILLLGFFFLVYRGSFGSEDKIPQGLEEVNVQFVWVPNAQFAGIYVADQKGYYKDEGIKIVYREYTTEQPVKDIVASGAADFGIDGADQVIIGRSMGQSLVAVAVIYRINPIGYASMKSLGVKDPKDYAGRKIGYLPDNSAVLFKAMIGKMGLNESQIKWVDYEYDLELFYNQDIEVVPIYVTDEIYEFQRKGFNVDVLVPEDYGVSFYGDTIITTEEIIEKRPELVERFLRATLKGWTYALQNPKEAVEITRLYDDEEYEAREEFIISASAPLIHTGESRIGWMEPDEWKSIQAVLLEQEIIQTPVDIQKAFTMEFLSRIYGGS